MWFIQGLFPKFDQNNHQILKLLLSCVSVKSNYFQPCFKANVHMFSLYFIP